MNRPLIKILVCSKRQKVKKVRYYNETKLHTQIITNQFDFGQSDRSIYCKIDQMQENDIH